MMSLRVACCPVFISLWPNKEQKTLSVERDDMEKFLVFFQKNPRFSKPTSDDHMNQCKQVGLANWDRA